MREPKNGSEPPSAPPDGQEDGEVDESERQPNQENEGRLTARSP